MDMVLSIGRSLMRNRQMPPLGLFAIGFPWPMVGVAMALGMGTLIGLSGGSLVLLMVLTAAVSYIAMSAAVFLAGDAQLANVDQNTKRRAAGHRRS